MTKLLSVDQFWVPGSTLGSAASVAFSFAVVGRRVSSESDPGSRLSICCNVVLS